MDAIQAAATPYFPVLFAVVFVLLLASTGGSRARGGLGAVLLTGAIGMIVIATLGIGTEARTLDVVNPFLRGPDSEPFPYITERVTAPAWRWPLAAAFALLVPGLWFFMRRDKHKPHPIWTAVLIGWWIILTRLMLEKSAAPVGIIWATGLTWSMPLVVAFVGGYAGARGASIGRWVFYLTAVGLLTRALIIGWAYLATTQGLGTHLDVGVLEDINPPIFAEVKFEPDDLVGRWQIGVLVPQIAFGLMAIPVGLVIGAIPYLIAKRRGAKPASNGEE